jgi:VWFA-related protein
VWTLGVLSGSASGPLQQDQRFATSAGTTLVEVVAFVSDRNGVPVNGLTRDNFELDEDGVRQEITHFSFVELPRDSVRTAEASAPHVRTDVAGNENRTGRSYVIVLDSQHVDPLRSGSVKQQARKFINDYVEPGDAVAVVTLGGQGISRSRTTRLD